MLNNNQVPASQQYHLPHKRAFVVQFSAQTDIADDKVQGRAEHIASGMVEHFQSIDELLAFIARMITPRI